MTREPPLDDVWESVPAARSAFQPGELLSLPTAARRYLEHAIAPQASLASAVRLRMHGEIKLKRWLPFTAEQVIRWGQSLIWNARVQMSGLPVRGFDHLMNGRGTMRWKIVGIIPVMTASGPDITRSAAGRMIAESVWLPSVLARSEVSWTATDASHAHARLRVEGETAELALTLDEQGGLKSLSMPRWGNPGGTAFHYEEFGGVVEHETRFGGYTIPTRLRVGWYIGTDRFESDGEFFRVTVDSAEYR